ncbi:MAG: phytoene/squalene synthase family protein [Pseudomonadota bacterium]
MSDDSAAYCATQVRRYDSDRYLCALFGPDSLRGHLFALYAFNLEIAKVREVVREPIAGQLRLQWWREAIAEMAGGGCRAHPVARALAAAFKERHLEAAGFERLLSAREADLADAPPADLAALEDYAEATSASLVHLALAVLGTPVPTSMAAGRHVGIAWALIGLLRAVPFHAAGRRLYLPQTLVRAAGLDIEELFAGRPGAGLAEVAREVAERSRVHLETARSHRREVPRAAVPALLPATLADLYLRRLEKAHFALFEPALQRPAGARAPRLMLAALAGRY